jgi:hypothetical protein
MGTFDPSSHTYILPFREMAHVLMGTQNHLPSRHTSKPSTPTLALCNPPPFQDLQGALSLGEITVGPDCRFSPSSPCAQFCSRLLPKDEMRARSNLESLAKSIFLVFAIRVR